MRLTRVFLNTFMGYGFEGLREIAKEARAELGPNTNVLFLNRKMTAFKVVLNDNYIVYYKNGGKRIPLEAIQHLPENFGGTQMEMSTAIRKTILQKLSS